MHTIRLQTNQHRLIANLRHAFNQRSMLGELLQNARRAQASEIRITVDQSSLAIHDNGCGIADLQSLIFIAESGWDEPLKSNENAFGMGALSTLYFAEHLSVHSRDAMFNARTADIIAGEPIDVVRADTDLVGTMIRLDGVQPPHPSDQLHNWVAWELKRLCEAFPVSVWLNGTEIPRPLASASLDWRQTSMGKILIDLTGARTQWRCFLQGLPIETGANHSRHQVVLLPDDTLAKLPDRQHLLNETQDGRRIQAAVDQAYRQALMDKKAALAQSEFVEHYAHVCLQSSNADLLNNLSFVPRGWFRDWQQEPAGFRHYWERREAEGVVSRTVLQELGVWQIDADRCDALTAEVYLEAAQAFLLEASGLDDGHWVHTLVRPIHPEDIHVGTGAILHRDADPWLADCEVELALVDTLQVHLEGESGYAVPAIRKDGTLYLTAQASDATRLVSDYVFEDRYEEDREDEDAKTLLTFIAVGCSSAPDRVVNALLPDVLRYSAQPKLAGATVRLVFDAAGKLQAVTA